MNFTQRMRGIVKTIAIVLSLAVPVMLAISAAAWLMVAIDSRVWLSMVLETRVIPMAFCPKAPAT